MYFTSILQSAGHSSHKYEQLRPQTRVALEEPSKTDDREAVVTELSLNHKGDFSTLSMGISAGKPLLLLSMLCLLCGERNEFPFISFEYAFLINLIFISL